MVGRYLHFLHHIPENKYVWRHDLVSLDSQGISLRPGMTFTDVFTEAIARYGTRRNNSSSEFWREVQDGPFCWISADLAPGSIVIDQRDDVPTRKIEITITRTGGKLSLPNGDTVDEDAFDIEMLAIRWMKLTQVARKNGWEEGSPTAWAEKILNNDLVHPLLGRTLLISALGSNPFRLIENALLIGYLGILFAASLGRDESRGFPDPLEEWTVNSESHKLATSLRSDMFMRPDRIIGPTHLVPTQLTLDILAADPEMAAKARELAEITRDVSMLDLMIARGVNSQFRPSAHEKLSALDRKRTVERMIAAFLSTN